MIYDCVLYNGEKELLEIRLNETKLFNQKVTTVIVCASKTHTGLDKPSHVEEIKESFEGFDIFCYLLGGLSGDTPREREAHQRNEIKTALNILQPEDDDIILISDVDEIPRARQINLFKKEIGFAALILDKYAYFLNILESEQSWDRARIMSWGYLKNKRPEEVRNSGYDYSIHHAGWHWSWIIDPVNKLHSFSHTELDTPENVERVKRKENIWSSDEFKILDINLSHPEYLYKNQDRFKTLLYKK